jgi:hypothetical protein
MINRNEQTFKDQVSGLFELDIPSPAPSLDTFLDITKQSSRETVISRIYVYYLDASNNKVIADLFLNSLLELIYEKKSIKLELTGHVCYTEVKTTLGNKIDFHIISSKTNEEIIIENKIFHNLDNDLLDYWNFGKCEPHKKVGVLLTLKPKAIPINVNDKFINITHAEWINRILHKGLPSDLSANQYIYLTDFFRNMKQLFYSMELNEQARFFFEHSNLVLKVTETERMARKYVQDQFAIVADQLSWELSSSGANYQQIWNHQKAYYTLITDKLFQSERSITIIIELFDKAIPVDKELQKCLKDDPHYIKLVKDGTRKSNYVHFAYQWYRLDNYELENLAAFIVEKIKLDLEPVMQKVQKFLQDTI